MKIQHDCSQMFSQTITEPRRGDMIVAKRLARRLSNPEGVI
jgi:hypothetical protein